MNQHIEKNRTIDLICQIVIDLKTSWEMRCTSIGTLMHFPAAPKCFPKPLAHARAHAPVGGRGRARRLQVPLGTM